jgi:hypothetical protein
LANFYFKTGFRTADDRDTALLALATYPATNRTKTCYAELAKESELSKSLMSIPKGANTLSITTFSMRIKKNATLSITAQSIMTVLL